MTPKEQAQDLWLTYYELLPDGIYSNEATKAEAKKLVLITVNKIIEASPSKPIQSDSGTFGEDINLSIKYWKEVKTETENL